MSGRKIVGRMIEKLRVKKLNLSQPEFAELLGMELPKGRSTVNNWEQGVVQIKSDDLTLISQKTGYSVDWLLGLVDENNYSNDETIRLISDYTGLSTEAVTVLHEYKEHQITAQAKALDLLLSSTEGKAVLGAVFDYLTGDYDCFSMPFYPTLDDPEPKPEKVSNSVFLCKGNKPLRELPAKDIARITMLDIQDNLGILRDKMKEGSVDNG